MKNLKLRILAAFAAIFLLGSLNSCNYNSLVDQQQTVDQAWAEVERNTSAVPTLFRIW